MIQRSKENNNTGSPMKKAEKGYDLRVEKWQPWTQNQLPFAAAAVVSRLNPTPLVLLLKVSFFFICAYTKIKTKEGSGKQKKKVVKYKVGEFTWRWVWALDRRGGNPFGRRNRNSSSREGRRTGRPDRSKRSKEEWKQSPPKPKGF